MHKILKGTFFLTVLLFLCGINKVFFFKKLKIIHATISISLVIIALTIHTAQLIGEDRVGSILWNVAHSTEYLQLVIMSAVTSEDFFKKFVAKIQIVEDNIKVAKHISVVVTTNIVIIALFLYKILHLLIIVKPMDKTTKTEFTISQITVTCAELDCVWRMLLMLIIKNKVDQIYEILKELYPLEWFENRNADPEVHNHVTNLMEAYKTLAELTEDIARSIQISFIYRLASDMVVVFLAIYYFTTLKGSLMFSSSVVLLGFLAVLTLAPSVILEMIKSKSFDIKVLLMQQGLRANIKSKEKRALQLFTNVIVSQLIRLRMFGSYDMGSNFIVHYFQFLATYSIFILQTARYKFF